MDHDCPSCGFYLRPEKKDLKFLRPTPTNKYPTASGWYWQCPQCKTLLKRNEFNLETIFFLVYLFAFLYAPSIIQTEFMNKFMPESFISYFISLVMVVIPVHFIIKFLKKRSPKTSYWKLYKE